jgi:DNA (cytosine-5)-methyltransferase 1
MLSIGSLFSGIGGLELGLEWSGIGKTRWQCENDSFCRKVLAKHWPLTTRYEDVKNLTRPPKVDIVCGGFPCQDVSSAGLRAGLAGERSGLWREFARIVGDVGPKIVVVENVASGARLWLPTVRRDLHLLGYDSVALGVSARDVGGYHLRKRIFLVAHPYSPMGGQGCGIESKWAVPLQPPGGGKRLANAWTGPIPEHGRMANGLSKGLDARRVKALGNAVVPQCAMLVGLWLQTYENGRLVPYE